MSRARLVLYSAAVCGSLALAPGASAADTYVNGTKGHDSASCRAPAHACKTIRAGVKKAGAADTVHVASGTYPERVTLRARKSLVASGKASATIIAPGSGSAVTVPEGAVAGAIDGFTLRGVTSAPAVSLSGRATVRRNVFDGDLSDYVADVRIFPGGAHARVLRNDLTDPDPDSQYGIQTSADGVTISKNRIDGFLSSVEVNNGSFQTPRFSTVISRNTITGMHDPPGGGSGLAHGIFVYVAAKATITRNRIVQPGAGLPTGIEVLGGLPEDPRTIAHLHSNRIVGLDHGLSLNGDITVSLDSDLVASNFTGIYTGQATINATNVTFANNGRDMELFSDVTLTLDSSILENAIQETGTNLACVITYSRGPTTSGDPCQTFQTSADPGFVDPALGDYHLASDSALIDKGNPTAPPKGSQDIDGDARALDGPDGGSCSGAPRRDIGADEYRC